ncbi:MAG: CRTAC1 family protein [Planctomycetes bacterium]|nr:CRTAC1 family protein [Planctomycetota bacterium]
MSHALLLFVGALFASEPVVPTAEPALSVRGTERFEVVTRSGGDVIVPLLSRSERVVRAVRTKRGIGVRVSGGALTRSEYAEHADDERLVIDADGRLWRLHGMRLPRSVTRAGDTREWIAHSARQDGVGLTGRLVIDCGQRVDGERLVILPVDGVTTSSAVLVELKDSETVTWDASNLSADQILVAQATLVTTLSPLKRGESTTAADGGSETWFEAPPATTAGRTVSLIFSTDLKAKARQKARITGGLFRDVTQAVGVDMVHMEGPDLQLDIRPTMGPGAAWGDIDGDGWVDLFLVQGAGRPGSNVPTSRMYKNRGDGTFEDVTKACGLALRGAGMAALFFDADGDGDLDLFVANYGRNRLMSNDGRGRFSDISESVGLQSDRWHAGVCAADWDRDGDLDLYVTSYLHYDETQMPTIEELGRYRREDPIAMLPFAFPGEANAFLRNDRVLVREASTAPAPGLRLTDIAKELRLVDEAGRGMQALFWDFDRDGDQDLYVANDVSPNRFWRNDGGGQWKDIGFSTGVDDPRGSMGLAAGDVDGDGDEDLFITNWQLESNALYVNNLVNKTSAKSHVATFRDNSVQAGLGQLSVGVTKWGCETADFDLDGDLDIAYANGYTSPDYESTGICVGQPCHYFENDGDGKFTAAFEQAGPDFAEALASRCLLACDYDQDGDLDLVITANNGRARILRNESDHLGRHWLGVHLRGRGGNTFAIGAEVEIVVGSKTLRRTLRAGSSYLGGNAPELHFGLGSSGSVDACRVRWPSGKETTHAISSVDRFITLEEP